MKFILSDEDNVMINNKIRQVIGQLPIHYTKNKFYDLLSDGLSIYKGSTRQSLEDFLYMISTSSMLEKTDTMNDNFPDLEDVLQKFRDVNFKNISSESYDELMYYISAVSERIADLMNSCTMIQEIINDLLIALYTVEELSDDDETRTCIQIIKYTRQLFMREKCDRTTDQIEEMFVKLEGIQERLYPKLTSCDVLDEISQSFQDKIKELGLDKDYGISKKLTKLNSDNLFVELDVTVDDGVVDEAHLEEVKKKLFQKYAEIFSENETLINRAVMSAAIAELPVFFNNISELQNFIFDTLSACTDKAEKLACIEILEGIMEE